MNLVGGADRNETLNKENQKLGELEIQKYVSLMPYLFMLGAYSNPSEGLGNVEKFFV